MSQRNVPVPNTQPGQAITQSLINQLVDGANRARVVSGDGVNIRENGGILGISVPEESGKQHSVMVYVDCSTFALGNGGGNLPGGVYYGRLYTGSTIWAWNSGDTTISIPPPVPNVNNCYVVNVPEVGQTSHQFSTNFVTTGTLSRSTKGNLVVTINSNGNTVSSVYLGKYKVTAVSGSFPQWTYTCQKVVSYNSSLTNAARYVTDGINITVQNGMEQSGTASYTYPSGLTVSNATTGAVNSTSCDYKSIGVGAILGVDSIPKSDGSGYVYLFSEANSAQ